MIRGSRIKIALLLSTIFIVKILFANIGVLPVFDTAPQEKHIAAPQLSYYAVKGCRHLDLFSQERVVSCASPLEICEEDADEDDKSRTGISSPVLTGLFFSYDAEVINRLRGRLVQPHQPFTSPHRHISLCIFRV